MKYNFKSFMKNAFLVLGFAFLVAGCKHNSDEITESFYSYEKPTFKAGDVLSILLSGDGSQEKDYYCFTAENAGTVISHFSGKESNVYKYDINSYSFSYDSGVCSIEGTNNGTKQLYFMRINNYVYLYSKQNCYTRADGKKGLIGTYTMGDNKITFSKSGKAEAVFGGTSIEVKFKVVDGIVTIWDSSASIDFYYFSDYSLLPRSATSSLFEAEKIELSVRMDTSVDGNALIAVMKTLPDGFHYDLSNYSSGGEADLGTIKTLLDENPNKMFSISHCGIRGKIYTNGSSSKITSIPNNYFKDCKNLYKILIGYGLDTRITLGDSAFSGCTNLHEVWGSDQITVFGENCFAGCSALEYITFAKETTVKPNAFLNCSPNLSVRKSLVNTVKVADNEAFSESIDLSDANNLGTLLTSDHVAKYWKFE